MAHHIAVGEIAAQELELAGCHILYHLLRDLLALHGRGLLEGDYIRGNLFIHFQVFVHLAAAVTVPEIGYMAIFLGFGNGIFGDAGLAQHFRQGVLNDRRLHQVILGNVQIAVVLQHTGKFDTGIIAAVEFIKILTVKGQGNFLGPVATEVEQDYRIAIVDFCNRLAVPGHHESGQVLVDAAGFGAVGFDGLGGGSKLPSQTLDMGPPAQLHHAPVGFVTVHSHLHSAAAGGNGIIAAVGVQLAQHSFQLLHIFQGRGGGHITTI